MGLVRGEGPLSKFGESIILVFMKHFLLITLLCCAASVPVLAGDSDHSIKIIHDDGRVDVIDLRGTGVPEKVAPAPVAQPFEPAVGKPVGRSIQTIREEPVSRPVDPLKRDVVKAKPKPAPKAVKRVMVKPPPLPVQREITAGAVITRAKAISIALDYAPPSSDVEVFLSEFEGQQAYAVLFKVEQGVHEVLIHSVSGEVLVSRKREAYGQSAKPGHLPQGF